MGNISAEKLTPPMNSYAEVFQLQCLSREIALFRTTKYKACAGMETNPDIGSAIKFLIGTDAGLILVATFFLYLAWMTRVNHPTLVRLKSANQQPSETEKHHLLHLRAGSFWMTEWLGVIKNLASDALSRKSFIDRYITGAFLSKRQYVALHAQPAEIISSQERRYSHANAIHAIVGKEEIERSPSKVTKIDRGAVMYALQSLSDENKLASSEINPVPPRADRAQLVVNKKTFEEHLPKTALHTRQQLLTSSSTSVQGLYNSDGSGSSKQNRSAGASLFDCTHFLVEAPKGKNRFIQLKLDYMQVILRASFCNGSRAGEARTIFVFKKNGSSRFCVEYLKLYTTSRRGFNSSTNMADCIYAFVDTTSLFSLETNSSYWQDKVDKAGRTDKALTFYHRLGRFIQMSFALKQLTGNLPMPDGHNTNASDGKVCNNELWQYRRIFPFSNRPHCTFLSGVDHSKKRNSQSKEKKCIIFSTHSLIEVQRNLMHS